MAAGDYTVYDNAKESNSGNYVVTGQSAASAAALTFYVPFNPTRYTFYNIGTDSNTVPAVIYQWIRGMTGTYNLFTTATTGAVTCDSTNEVTIALVTTTTSAYYGMYSIAVPAAIQTNSGYYTLIVER